MLNRLLLIGNVVEKPEIKKGKSAAWTDVTLAVNRPGQKDKVDYIRCRLIGALAENSGKLTAGDLVYVEGTLELNKYKTKSGDSATAARMLVSYIRRLISRPATADVDQGQQPDQG
jgi:single-stranded DNA-binding protein